MTKGKRLLAAALVAALGACANGNLKPVLSERPVVGPLTDTAPALEELGPPPERPIAVAVYEFPDQTGQNKPNPTYADYSRAVTQGAANIVAEALTRAGGGSWFKVVERTKLDNLLRERKLIRDTYTEDLKKKPDALISPLRFADYLVEGGIVSFENAIATGGVGATYLGIGADVRYEKFLITVTMRLVRIRNGDLVRSVTASKTLYSVGLTGGLNRYASLNRLIDAGVASDNLLNALLKRVHVEHTTKEPTQIAIREAIEAGVAELIRQSAPLGVWTSASERGAPARRASDDGWMRTSPRAVLPSKG
jgi:curli production assembly/transport component CsgG